AETGSKTARREDVRSSAMPRSTDTTTSDHSAAEHIDQRIAELGDWRGDTLAHIRKLILAADPEIVEEWKWGNPVWSRTGIICTGETYKAAVKTTFAKGASVDDPRGL